LRVDDRRDVWGTCDSCSLGRKPSPKMVGPGPAQLPKIFLKICNFPAYFLLNFA
jgi:hypothetical protein